MRWPPCLSGTARRSLENQQALSEQQQKDQHEDDEGYLEKAPRERKPFALRGRQPKQDAHCEPYHHQESGETNDEH
jgi:hypothetical protein